MIDGALLDQLGKGELRDRSVEEKIELAVRWFADRSAEFGQAFPSDGERDYPVAWCRTPQEWQTILRAVVKELEYLHFAHPNYSVSLDGWRWLAKKPERQSADAFVAMNFHPDYHDLRLAIAGAVTRAGYNPVIIAEDVYSGGVMDRVLGRIRQSRFVIADYSGNRGGVYYEAGFGFGLGKTVLHVCGNEQLDAKEKDERLHFDVSHLKMIHWDAKDLGDFSRRLEDHIRALFDQGPLSAIPSG